MNILKAYLIAKKAHKGQIDKGGNKYINHPIRVAKKVKTKQAKIVALLHDVLEDTTVTIDDIEKMFNKQIAFQVDCLTKKENQTPEQYLSCIMQDKISVEVKMSDLQDNMNLFRLKTITDSDLQRLKKYQMMYFELAKEYKKFV